MRRVLFVGLFLIAVAIALWAQTGTGIRIYTYTSVSGGPWLWGPVTLDPAQFRLERGLLSIIMPSPVTMREATDTYVVKATDTAPLSFLLRGTPTAETLMVFVGGIKYTQSFHYSLDGNRVAFNDAHSPTPGDVVEFRYRY